MTSVANAARKLGTRNDHRKGCRVQDARTDEDRVGGELGCQPSKRQRAENRTPAKRCEEGAETVGSYSEVLTGDQRQECPERYGRRDENNCSQHDAPYDRFVPHVAATRAQGRHEAFSACHVALRAAPQEQRHGQEDH